MQRDTAVAMMKRFMLAFPRNMMVRNVNFIKPDSFSYCSSGHNWRGVADTVVSTLQYEV